MAVDKDTICMAAELDDQEAEIEALRADLKAVAVAAQAIFDKEGFPLPHGFNLDNMEYLALRQALARPGVQEALKDD